MQQANVTGFITKQAEVEKKENHFLTTFGIGSTKRFKDKEGNKKEKTNWYRVFHRTSNDPKELLKYLTKGSKVLVAGDLDFYMSAYEGNVSCVATINTNDLELQSFKSEEESKEASNENK